MFGRVMETSAESAKQLARYFRKSGSDEESFSSHSVSIVVDNECAGTTDLNQFKQDFEEVKANIQSELKVLKRSVAELYDASPEDSNNTNQLQEVECDLQDKKKSLEHCMNQIMDIENENLKMRNEIQVLQTYTQKENQCVCYIF